MCLTLPSPTHQNDEDREDLATPGPGEGRVRRLRATPRTERLNINIHETTAQALQDMSRAKGITVTETVRRAVALLKLLEDQTARGIEIQLVDPAEPNKVRVLQPL